jgi:hypothetical protein
LKPRRPVHPARGDNVAPHAGAWIETPTLSTRPQKRASPPTRGRGLKRESIALHRKKGTSPPTRGRGLKRLALARLP